MNKRILIQNNILKLIHEGKEIDNSNKRDKDDPLTMYQRYLWDGHIDGKNEVKSIKISKDGKRKYRYKSHNSKWVQEHKEDLKGVVLYFICLKNSKVSEPTNLKKEYFIEREFAEEVLHHVQKASDKKNGYRKYEYEIRSIQL